MADEKNCERTTRKHYNKMLIEKMTKRHKTSSKPVFLDQIVAALKPEKKVFFCFDASQLEVSRVDRNTSNLFKRGDIRKVF